MSINVDAFLDRMPSENYKCFDFVREVWRESFGIDIGDQLSSLALILNDRKLVVSELKGFEKLEKPIDPCFVVFQRKRTTPHIGIWYQGRVLHLGAGQSAQYSRFINVGRRYTKVSYYR